MLPPQDLRSNWFVNFKPLPISNENCFSFTSQVSNWIKYKNILYICSSTVAYIYIRIQRDPNVNNWIKSFVTSTLKREIATNIKEYKGREKETAVTSKTKKPDTGNKKKEENKNIEWTNTAHTVFIWFQTNTLPFTSPHSVRTFFYIFFFCFFVAFFIPKFPIYVSNILAYTCVFVHCIFSCYTNSFFSSFSSPPCVDVCEKQFFFFCSRIIFKNAYAYNGNHLRTTQKCSQTPFVETNFCICVEHIFFFSPKGCCCCLCVGVVCLFRWDAVNMNPLFCVFFSNEKYRVTYPFVSCLPTAWMGVKRMVAHSTIAALKYKNGIEKCASWKRARAVLNGEKNMYFIYVLDKTNTNKAFISITPLTSHRASLMQWYIYSIFNWMWWTEQKKIWFKKKRTKKKNVSTIKTICGNSIRCTVCTPTI